MCLLDFCIMMLPPLKETSGGFQDEKLEERLDSQSHACESQADGQMGRDFPGRDHTQHLCFRCP